MEKLPKMFFVGGFLGAGKTTAIQSLAKMFASEGIKAAAITNDQARGLVDTLFLSDGALPTEEVAGSCFCCNFNGLADAVHHCIASAAPDVILAEPVGSCTDIVATVIRPMRMLMKDKVDVYAYSVLVEPDRWVELTDKGAPWSMKYLFDKQLQEADFIVLTKLDTLTAERATELLDDAARLYSDTKVVGISVKDDAAMERWLRLVQTTPPGERLLREIDYGKYAEAEAEMGWLNGMVTMKFREPSDGKVISARFVSLLSEGIAAKKGSIGHLKLLTVGEAGSVKVGVTHAGEMPSLDGAFTGPLSHCEVTVNIRATLSPGDLASIVLAAVERFGESVNAECEVSAVNTFRPGAPNPTYRYNE